MTRNVVAQRMNVRDFISSIFMNGSSTKIAATALSGLSAGFSISCRFKVNQVANAVNIVSNTASATDQMAMSVSGGKILAGYLATSVLTGGTVSLDMLKTGNWYLAVYTFNGTVGALYINNVVQTTTASAPSVSATTGLMLGARTDSSRFLSGNLGETMIFDHALNSTERGNLWFNGPVPSGLLRRYKLDENTGSTATDSSGNAANGTITGVTWSADVPMRARGLSGPRANSGARTLA